MANIFFRQLVFHQIWSTYIKTVYNHLYIPHWVQPTWAKCQSNLSAHRLTLSHEKFLMKFNLLSYNPKARCCWNNGTSVHFILYPQFCRAIGKTKIILFTCSMSLQPLKLIFRPLISISLFSWLWSPLEVEWESIASGTIYLDWLFGWFIDWLVVSLIHGLTDWLTEWITVWRIYWLTYWLIGRLIDWPIDWLVDWLMDWWIDWLID